jgi:hypothetical protein
VIVGSEEVIPYPPFPSHLSIKAFLLTFFSFGEMSYFIKDLRPKA